MDKDNLIKEEIDKLEQLIKVTTSIDNIYTKLYTLEINNQKETDEYNESLEVLKKEILQEEKIYEELKKQDSKEYLKYTKYLLQKTKYKNINIEQLLMNQQYEDRIFARIITSFMEKYELDSKVIKNIIPQEFTDLLNDMGIEEPEKMINESIKNSIAITEAFEKDLHNTYLYILKETIESNQYKYYINKLILSKYNHSFIYKKIEQSMISNNFNIEDTLYVTSHFIGDMNGLDDNSYDLMADHKFTKIHAEQVSELLEISDMEYSDTNKAITSILRQCLLRATFSLMSDKALEETKQIFDNYIESPKYLDRHPYDKISIQLILNCYNSIKKDKTKQNILSLRPRKI